MKKVIILLLRLAFTVIGLLLFFYVVNLHPEHFREQADSLITPDSESKFMFGMSIMFFGVAWFMPVILQAIGIETKE